MEDPIEGKVAALLNENVVVINRGRRAGVAEGMLFSVFAPGDELKDLATGKSLGIIEYVKAKVEIIHVQEKMSSAMEIPSFKTGEIHSFPEDHLNIPSMYLEIGDNVRQYEDLSRLVQFLRYVT
jgi:hypothetical protein